MSTQLVTKSLKTFNDIDGQPLENGFLYIGTAGLQPDSNQIQAYWDSGLTLTATQPIRTIAGYPVNNGVPANVYVNSDDYSLLVNNKNNSQVDLDLNAGTSGGYNVGLTGSVSRSVASKLAESVSIKDFGAVGDGTTDDTVAVQAAIDSGAYEIHVPFGVYIITSSIIVTNKVGYSIIGLGGNDKSGFVWGGAAGGVMFEVSKMRNFVMKSILIRGSITASAVAATCLRITSGAGNTNTLHTYEDCNFERVTGRAIDLQGNNLQLDMIYFNRCVLSGMDEGIRIEGASTFMIHFDGGTLGDFTSYGFNCQTGGNLFVRNMGFIQGGTPGDPLVGTPWIFSRTHTFNDITIENCQHEGQSLFLQGLDDSASANKSTITMKNVIVGCTASGTFNVIDYQQRGQFIWLGGNLGTTYTVNSQIYFAKPGSPGDGGNIYINGLNTDGTIPIVTSGNTYRTGIDKVGTMQIGNGLQFPATQVVIAEPNTLDDYEEVDFTPVIYGSTGAGAGTYTSQTGSAVKVGRSIVGTLTVSWTAHTGTGDMRVSGLPYALSGSCPLFFNGITYTGTHVQGFIVNDEVYLSQTSSGVADTYIPMDTAGQMVINFSGVAS